MKLTVCDSGIYLCLTGYCPLLKVIEVSKDGRSFQGVHNELESTQLLKVTLSDRSLDYFYGIHVCDVSSSENFANKEI